MACCACLGACGFVLWYFGGRCVLSLCLFAAGGVGLLWLYFTSLAVLASVLWLCLWCTCGFL